MAVQKKADSDIAALDALGKNNLVGQTVITPEQLNAVKAVLKREAKAQETMNGQKVRIASLERELGELKHRLEILRARASPTISNYFVPSNAHRVEWLRWLPT